MKKEYFQKIYNVDTWVGLHIGQISYSRNLILTLAVAALGFTINHYQNVKETRIGLIITAFLFLVSVAFGITIAFLEAENYRLYREISRIIEQSKTDPKDEMDETIFEAQRERCNIIERKNRVFFKLQVWIFFLAMLILSLIIFSR